MKEHPEEFPDDIQVLPYTATLEISLMFWVACVGGTLLVISLIGFIYCIVRMFGNPELDERMITAFRKEQGDTPGLRSKIDQFFWHSEIVPGIWADQEFFAGFYNTAVCFLSMRDIVWIFYAEATGSGTAGMVAASVSGLTRCLVICTRQHQRYQVRIKNEEQAAVVYRYLSDMVPYVTTGYHAELEQKYNDREDPFTGT